MSPGFSDTLAPAFPVSLRIPVSWAGNLTNLYLRQNLVGSPAGTITYTVRVNSIATALTLTTANNNSNDQTIALSAPVAQGDLVDVEVTHGALGPDTPGEVVVTIEVTP